MCHAETSRLHPRRTRDPFFGCIRTRAGSSSVKNTGILFDSPLVIANAVVPALLSERLAAGTLILRPRYRTTNSSVQSAAPESCGGTGRILPKEANGGSQTATDRGLDCSTADWLCRILPCCAKPDLRGVSCRGCRSTSRLWRLLRRCDGRSHLHAAWVAVLRFGDRYGVYPRPAPEQVQSKF